MNRSLILALVSLTVACNTPMDLGGKIKPASVVTGGACTQDADCVAGDQCSNQQCVADSADGGTGVDGTTCTANNQCTSGICGSAGSGHCCAAACPAATDAGCYATDCDSSGACVYPAASGCPCGRDTDCKDTRICVDGACVFPGTGVCFIQGQFISNGNYNPANSCQDCEPTLSDIDWTTNFKVSSTTQAEPDAGGVNGPRPFSYAVGGRLDSVLVAELISGRVTVLRGGTIQSSFATNMYPELVASMDLNGDGLNDVIVAGPQGASVLEIALFLNDGDGGFTPGATYSRPQDEDIDGGGGAFYYRSYEEMETGDFNGDGSQILSLGVSTNKYNSQDQLYYTELQLYALDGDGGLAAPTTITQQLPQQGVQRIGDFNEDGKADILYWAPSAASFFDGGSWAPANVLTLLLSNGTGQFSATSEPFPSPVAYHDGTVVGDFNGDGHLDVTFVNADGTISVELGDGQGGFGSAKNSGLPTGNNAYGQVFLVASDFNGDGDLDLARLDSYCQGPCEQTLTIWVGRGDGTFLSPEPAVLLSSFPAVWGVGSGTLGFSGPMVTLDPGNGRPDLAITYGYPIIAGSTNGYATAVLHNGCQ